MTGDKSTTGYGRNNTVGAVPSRACVAGSFGNRREKKKTRKKKEKCHDRKNYTNETKIGEIDFRYKINGPYQLSTYPGIN
jgi:hypothetical protein